MNTAIPSQILIKICSKCGFVGPTRDFYKKLRANGRSAGKHGVAAECIKCTVNRTKTRYNGPQKVAINLQSARLRRVRYKTVKDLVFEHYGGYVCACCGENEPLFLTLDHVNNDGGDFRRRIAGKQSRGAGFITYHWLKQNNFPAGYQILCANCNFGKRMNGGVCPHHTRKGVTTMVDTPVGPSGPKHTAALVAEEIVCS